MLTAKHDAETEHGGRKFFTLRLECVSQDKTSAATQMVYQTEDRLSYFIFVIDRMANCSHVQYHKPYYNICTSLSLYVVSLIH